MNCAIPCAPARLMVLLSKLLSCQIRLAKNGIGRLLAIATDAMALQTRSRDGCRGGLTTTAAGLARGSASSAPSSLSNESAYGSAIFSITEAGKGFAVWLME